MKMLSRAETARVMANISGKILITTHKNPDGDAIGSILGWFNFLKNMGKNPRIILKGKVPYIYNFLPSVEYIETAEDIEENFDWAIITDTSELKRTGFTSIPSKYSISIDHHITSQPFTTLSIVETEISSSCELSLEIMKILNTNLIDYKVALPIYTGIITDTGKLSYSNTSRNTIINIAFLMDRGVKPYTVHKNLFERNRINKLRLLELVLKTLKFELNGKVAHITMPKRYLEDTKAYLEETEGFINYPRSIEGVEVAIFFKEIRNNFWKISLRSKGNINVARICTIFGGGGHRAAAGFECMGNIKDIKVELLKTIQKFLNQEDPEL